MSELSVPRSRNWMDSIITRLIGCLFLLVILTGCAPKEIPPGKVNWTEFSEIQQNFPRTGLPLFLYISQNHCEWCEQMDSTIFNRPEIADHLNNTYLCANVNIDEDMPITINGKDYTYDEFFDLLHLREIPAYFFFDANGQPIGVLNSAMHVITFKQLLVYVKNRHFFRTQWADFLKLPESKLDTVWGEF